METLGLKEQLVKRSNKKVLSIFVVLFFMWGLLTVMNEVLDKHLSYIFDLTYSLSTLIGLTFFSTYFIVSIPAGKLFNDLGFKKGIFIGWTAAITGCLVMSLAIHLINYNIFLLGLIVLAGGFTILQVGANLYVVILGSRKTAASRLTLMQAFNSLGTFVAPFFAYQILWRSVGVSDVVIDQMPAENLFAMEASFVHIPYLILAGLMVLFAIVLKVNKIPHIDTSNIEPLNKITSLRRRHVLHFSQLRLGAFAIFAYVGAEVALATYLFDFAQNKVAWYWGLAMFGRFVGAYILVKVKPGKAVGFCAIMACTFVVLSILTSGEVSIWIITLIGLFNSILFPSIFALGINGLGKYAEEGAAVLVMFIVGGAVIPFMVRNFSYVNYEVAFIIPVICYFYIALYGLKLSKYEKQESK
ncbi:sugar MFS transporter [Cytophagaceae bacterium ABcell3]|nr:sugar MFS transporter [Cytophagaceae bacterium ABcell3]